MLVDALQRRVMGHCLQDLACSKCREVTMYNMARRCKCAGDFALTAPLAVTLQLVETFRGIAEHYIMPILAEQVEDFCLLDACYVVSCWCHASPSG